MRQVVMSDAPELARLLQACELDDNPNAARIARVILETTRATLVETDEGGALIGFVDAFMTVTAEGAPRWEVDLLGVHPQHRGRGTAQRLIRAAVQAGEAAGAPLMRAIVKEDNAPSLAAFRRCGFAPAEQVRDLYVSGQAVDDIVPVPAGAYFISVCTLTYNGIWLEGDQSLAALRCAQAIRTKYGWDIAGALAPVNSETLADFALVGQYLHLRRKILTR